MPTIDVNRKDLQRFIGKFNDKQLEKILRYVKSEIKSEELGKLRIEIKDINRPDLWSVEGIAREINLKKGNVKQYKLTHDHFKVITNKNVKSVRPFIACVVAKGININDVVLEQLIQLQEILCENFGRGREQAALGVYDLDKIKWPITYKAVNPNSVSFVPLGFSEKLTLKKILKKHEKGRRYGNLIMQHEKWPILLDSTNEVLSMPPIINSAFTGKVTKETKNLFIEVTGNKRFVLPILTIFSLALADRGAKLYDVIIQDGGKKYTWPDFSDKTIVINKDDLKLLGFEIKQKQLVDLLKKCGFRIEQQTKDKITLSYPFYRYDILDGTDIIEDLLIAYGYENVEPELPHFEIENEGVKQNEQYSMEKLLRNRLIGLGMQEVLTFILTDKQTLMKNVRLKVKPAKLENPVSANYEYLRNNLYPEMLKFLMKNKNASYPQNLFEIGDVYESEKTNERRHICIAMTDKDITFTNAKQVLDYITKNLGIQYKLKPVVNESFIEGRTGEIMVNDKPIGIIGEVHPSVLNNFKLKKPVVVIEMNVD